MTTVMAGDFIDALSYREFNKTHDSAYKLAFSTGRSGPSFGPIQLDFGQGNSNAVTAITNILTASGFSEGEVDLVLAAGQTITAYPYKIKQEMFTRILGGGDLTAGQAALDRINVLLSENSDYIDAVSSDEADHLADRINAYFSDVGFTSTPDTNVVSLLAEIRNQIGNLKWLENMGGPTNEAEILTALNESGKIGNLNDFNIWRNNYAGSIHNNTDKGSWYINSDGRDLHIAMGSPAPLPTAAQAQNIISNSCPVTLETWQTVLSYAGSPHYEPLVINLNGQDLANTTSLDDGVQFDVNNDGFAEKTAWTGIGSGILVNDSADDPVTNGSQLFGTATSLSGGGYAIDGFDALADLDSNSDGVINSSDSAWSDLRVWIDDNVNGITDTGELVTLGDVGIASISLTTTATNEVDASGNFHGLTATYTRTDSTTGGIDDVSFLIDPTQTVPDTLVSVSPTIADLPDLPGRGTVTSLQQAMQIQANASDTTLENYVEDFIAATDDAARNSLVDQIIYKWTGVSGVSSSARGSFFDARKLEAMEQFNGQSYLDPINSTANPSAQSVAILTAAYNAIHNQVLGGLLAQAGFDGLFNLIQLTFDEIHGNYFWDFSAAETQILAGLSINRAAGLSALSSFNSTIHALGMDQGAGYTAFRNDLIAEGADVAATFSGGASVVYGTAGDDVITAWKDNQTILAGQGGNDTLIGGGDNQTFYGSTGSNLFIGGDGDNEVFFGGASTDIHPGATDIFIAGHGTQFFYENWLGAELVIYGAGCGDLTITNFRTTNNESVIQLDGSIDRLDIAITSSGTTQTITDGVSGDQITVQNRSVPFLTFVDGTTLNLRALNGTHLATSGSTLSGTTLDDIYIYHSGTGHVTLSDTGGTNTLWMDEGFDKTNVSLTSSGNDLLITDGISGDQITVLNRSVQTLLFVNGTTANLLTVGSAYTLSGGSLSATGTALNDTYSYASGAGSASISDPGGSNTLALSGGIVSGDLVFTGSGTDLLIADGVSGDQVLIAGQLSGRTVVQTAVFSGGGSMALSGLALHEASGQTVLNGTTGGDTLLGNAGSQTLNGNGGNDVFVAGAGHTTANGGTGDDTYSFASGNGTLTINDASGLNRIVFGAGVDAGDVSWSGSGSDLLITDGVSGDLIVVKGQLGPQFVMDSIVFDDDSTLALEGIAIAASGQTVVNDTPADDTLIAAAGTQTLISHGGNDTFIGAAGTETMTANVYGGDHLFLIGSGAATAQGGAGNDTYSYAPGSGLLSVTEGGGQNTLVLGSGVDAGDISLTASGADLVLTDGVSGDTITLKGQLSAVEGVQTLVFDDDSTMALEGLALTIPGGATTLLGTPGADTLTATSGTQTLIGNGGNDVFVARTGSVTAIGGNGDDSYSFASGAGHMAIQDNSGSNRIVLGSGIDAGDISLAASGHDLVITDGVSGDQITVKDQLTTKLGVAELVFDDASTLALEGVALAMPSGATTLFGTPGNDTLTATSGTQTLQGNGGGDTLVGATGNDVMIGGSGADTFIGGTGTDVMTGAGGNDTFIAAVGATTMAGGTGNDLYSYASGDGFMLITDSGGANTLKLGTGLTAANVVITEGVSGSDLALTDGVSGDDFRISGGITGASALIQTLIYGDGTTVNMNAGLALNAHTGSATLNGTAGSDTLFASSGTQVINGNGGNDIFVSGSGTATMNGSSGNDVYSYTSGSGKVTIVDAGGTDTLKLGSGLTSSNVALSEAANGADLVITDGTVGDQITIKNGLASASRLEKLIYGDGSTLDLTSGLTLTATSGTSTLFGTANADVLIGTSGTQTLNGGGGNDTFVIGTGVQIANGSSGNDIYSLASGAGTVSISDTGGTDTLVLTNLSLAATTLSESRNGADLWIFDGVSGDDFRIIGAVTGSNKLEKIIYSGGTTVDLTSSLTVTAPAGTTTLQGLSGNDTLISTVGTQTLIGGGGDDVYSYASGNGKMTISDTSGTDTLKLGAGITSSNISLSESGSGQDLIIFDGTSGDQVTVKGYLSSSSNRIETIKFNDGSTMNLSSVILTATPGNTTLNGTAGNDTLVATAGNQVINGQGGSDVFIGGSGTQTLNGNTGNDIFVIGTGVQIALGGTGDDVYSLASGAGTVSISDTGGTDKLIFTDLTPAGVTLSESRNGADFWFFDNVSGDDFRVIGGVTGTNKLETIVYSDGTTVSLVSSLTVTAPSGTTTLQGLSGNDTLISTVGTQTLIGSSGDDVYSYASSNGNLTVNDSSGTDTLKLGSGLTSSNVSFSETNGADLLIFDGVSGDQITLKTEVSSSTARVETLIYGDGSTLSLTNGLVILATSGTATVLGTAGNDTLIGSAGTQTLTGNGGNNTFISGSGSQTAVGGSGNDVYSFVSGNGSFTINEAGGTDMLILGTGLTAATVSMREGGNGNDLFITDSVNGGDFIRLNGEMSSTTRVENLVFGDGTTLSMTGGLTLVGSSGTGTLNGTAGNDILTAASGTQTINGNGGNDTFISASGTASMNGSTGNDTYSYIASSGKAVILDTGGTDTLKLDSSLNLTNVSLSQSTNDLLITDGISGDQVLVKNFVTTSADRIEKILFSDGSSINLSSVLFATAGNTTLSGTSGAEILVASAGNQVINGNGGSDTFYGASGTETLNGNQGTNGNNTFIVGTGPTTANGGTGDDIYVFASGHGLLTINEAGGTDTLRLGGGLTSSNISISESTDGADLLFGDGTTTDLITLKSQMVVTGNQVETLVYGNGTSLNLTNGLTLSAASGAVTLNGTVGNDTLTGNTGTQTLNGNGGNDLFIAGAGTSTINGGSGNDTYSYVSGDGHLTIIETGGTNTLKLGTGLTASNVSFSESSGGADLLVTDGTTGDLVTIKSQLTGSGTQVEKLIFGDGSTLVLTNGLAVTAASGTATLNGTAGNDTLTGNSGTQTINGNGGNDLFIAGSVASTINSGSGNDTYSYVSGDGYLTIVETGGTDTLKLGTGLTASNVSFSESSDGADLLVADGTTGDLVTIKSQLTGSGTQVEKLIFGDGSTLNLMSGLVITAASGNSTLNGTVGNDTLTGSSGNNSILGNTGDDIIVGAAGSDIIDGGDGVDTLDYSAAPAAVTVSMGDTIALDGYGATDTLYNIENVIGSAYNDYIGGTTADNTLWGGAGNDTLVGSDGNDTFVGGAGNDSINGGSGLDIVDYSTVSNGVTVDLTAGTATGDGTDSLISINEVIGSAYGDTINGSSSVDTLIGGDGNDVIYGQAGNDNLSGGAGNDTLQGGVGFDTLDGGAGVDTVDYSDATSAVTVSLATTSAQSTGGSGTDTISNFENLNGSAYNDVLTGNGNNNILTGGDGDDTLIEPNGSDTLYGGNGNDTYSLWTGTLGSSEVMTVQDSAGTSDKITLGFSSTSSSASLVSSYLSGHDLHLVYNSGGNNDEIVIQNQYTADDSGLRVNSIDTIEYSDHVAVSLPLLIVGTSGNNTLSGSSGADVIDGLAGIDTIHGNGGDDLIYGGGSQDFLYGDDGNDTIYGGAFSDVISGGNGSDIIYGNTEADVITGDAGNDTLYGNNGFDILSGEGGNDYIDGGADTDDVSYADSTSGVTVDLSTGTASDGFSGTDTLINVEGVIGSDYDDLITGGSAAAIFTGDDGNDTIYAGSGGGTLEGDNGNDTLYGSTGFNVYKGGAGNDIFHGESGNNDTAYYDLDTAGVTVNLATGTATDGWGNTDTLYSIENATGSSYNDIITGTSGVNTLNGGSGNDTLSGGDGNDAITGAAGNDSLYGENGNDQLIGGAGNDVLDGGAGFNNADYRTDTAGIVANLSTGTVIDGYGGTDTLSNIQWVIGSNFNDTLTGSSGNDQLSGQDGNDLLEGAAGTDVLDGGNGTDTVTYINAGSGVTVSLATTSSQSTGGAGSDTITNVENLTGSAYGDTLTGNSGNNVLAGGDGLDTLTGGSGVDTFLFDTTAFNNIDVIADFSTSEGDAIDIKSLIPTYDPMSSTLSQFVYAMNDGSGNSLLQVDRDGPGSTYSFQTVAQINGVTSLNVATLVANGNIIVH